VATPDDLLLKREEVVTTLRDNVLFECGLFMGALGRRRTFLFAPKGTHVELPTDLRGLSIAKYAWSDSAPGDSLKPAIEGVVLAIKAEWRRMQDEAREFVALQTLGEQHYALVSLLSAFNRLIDVLIELPQQLISGVHDRAAFEKGKSEAVDRLREVSNLWLPFAETLNIRSDFLVLVSEFEAAIKGVPFYRDLRILEAPEVVVRDLPWLKRIYKRLFSDLSPEARDFASRLRIRDTQELRILRAALNPQEEAIERQVEQTLRLLSAGSEIWWKTHGPNLIRELRKFQRQLVEMLQGMTYVYLKS
jgi:hypothetical protein